MNALSDTSLQAPVGSQPAQHSSRLYLAELYDSWQACFAAQPPAQQRYLEAQGRQLAETLVQHRVPARFALPTHVVVAAEAPAQTGAARTDPVAVPAEQREHHLGGLLERLTHADLGAAINQRLSELGQAPDAAVAVAAGLLRYATARYMVHELLPVGRPVTYRAADGEEIPTIPVGDGLESAVSAPSDAIAEEGPEPAGRGELQAPFVPAARHFFLPQWVMADDMDRLLVSSLAEAEARLGSMQQFMAVLEAAVRLAPYFVVDAEYQRKRCGMLGQLVNQGRALARYETEEMIRTIQQRAAAGDLNRGLSLSVPYFDDQALELRTRDFDVIPAGRIMFIPAFVVQAARQEQAKVVHETRLSRSTRQHLRAELRTLERVFARAFRVRRSRAARNR